MLRYNLIGFSYGEHVWEFPTDENFRISYDWVDKLRLNKNNRLRVFWNVLSSVPLESKLPR